MKIKQILGIEEIADWVFTNPFTCYGIGIILGYLIGRYSK